MPGVWWKACSGGVEFLDGSLWTAAVYQLLTSDTTTSNFLITPSKHLTCNTGHHNNVAYSIKTCFYVPHLF